MNKTLTAMLLALVCSGAAQAQSCPCNSSATVLPTAAAISALVSGKMVCASLGSETWQEWHNGSGNSGTVTDYKKGPGDPSDPSEQVGSYNIASSGNSASISYTYGAQTYTYAVCQAGASYTFCGASFGGRDITNVAISTTPGLQSCAGVSATASKTRKP